MLAPEIDHPMTSTALADATTNAPALDEELIDHPLHGSILNVRTSLKPVTRPDGSTYQHTVIRFGSGLLGVAVPRLMHRGMVHLGLIEITRHAVDTTALEFPRGGVADLGPHETMRELEEETGLVCQTPTLLGVIHPDSGTLALTGAVYLAPIRPDLDEHGSWTRQHDGHLDPETGSTFRWIPAPEVYGAVAQGRITCGITLSALTLLSAHR